MAKGTDEFGDLEVRIVLQVKINREDWARLMLGVKPETASDSDIRNDVKRYVRDSVSALARPVGEGGTVARYGDTGFSRRSVPIIRARAEGLYDQ